VLTLYGKVITVRQGEQVEVVQVATLNKGLCPYIPHMLKFSVICRNSRRHHSRECRDNPLSQVTMWIVIRLDNALVVAQRKDDSPLT
jgi:hypothetical protein